MLNPKLQAHFEEYEFFHQHPTNRLTHKIAIPAIVFHILVMLDWLQIPGADLISLGGTPYGPSMGHLFFLGIVGWYATLNPIYALIMTLLFAPSFVLGAYLPWWSVVVLAVIAWAVQLAGHLIWEKKSPAFVKNLLQALVGPLFFLATVIGDYKIGVASFEETPDE